jgi:hypothetical protein
LMSTDLRFMALSLRGTQRFPSSWLQFFGGAGGSACGLAQLSRQAIARIETEVRVGS